MKSHPARLIMAIFLVLSIVFNSLFAACYKIAAFKKCNLQAVNVWVYVGSASTMLLYIIALRSFPFHFHALLLGSAAGAIAFFCTLSFFYHIKHGQLSASWTVVSLAVSFPVLASIFIWNEMPSTKQIVGLLLILVALTFFGKHEAGLKVKR